MAELDEERMSEFLSLLDAKNEEMIENNKKFKAFVERMSDERKLNLILKSQMEDLSNANRPLDIEVAREQFNEKVTKGYEAEKAAKGDVPFLSFEEYRSKALTNGCTNHILKCFAAKHINKTYNPNFKPELNKGYCTVAVMSCFDKMNKDGMFGDFMPKDKEISAHPATFVKHLLDNPKYAKFVHKTDENNPSFKEIIKDKQIRSGALVCMTFQKDAKETSLDSGHTHLVLYRNANSEKPFMSFNNDLKESSMENALQSGYVIDLLGMMKSVVDEKARREKIQDYGSVVADKLRERNKAPLKAPVTPRNINPQNLRFLRKGSFSK